MNANTTCTECGQPGATDTTITFTNGEQIDARVHTTCAAAVVRRADEWDASVEGRIAQAQHEGRTVCLRCATTEDVHQWTLTDADGVHEATACTRCAAAAETPDVIVRIVRTAEQRATDAEWDAQGIGRN